MKLGNTVRLFLSVSIILAALANTTAAKACPGRLSPDDSERYFSLLKDALRLKEVKCSQKGSASRSFNRCALGERVVYGGGVHAIASLELMSVKFTNRQHSKSNVEFFAIDIFWASRQRLAGVQTSRLAPIELTRKLKSTLEFLLTKIELGAVSQKIPISAWEREESWKVSTKNEFSCNISAEFNDDHFRITAGLPVALNRK